jgi:hypothetical protein
MAVDQGESLPFGIVSRSECSIGELVQKEQQTFNFNILFLIIIIKMGNSQAGCCNSGKDGPNIPGTKKKSKK